MLVHVYLGALVLGTVLLAMALLLGRGAPRRVRWFRLVGLFSSFFGLTAISVRSLGVVPSIPATLALAILAGLAIASGARALDRG